MAKMTCLTPDPLFRALIELVLGAQGVLKWCWSSAEVVFKLNWCSNGLQMVLRWCSMAQSGAQAVAQTGTRFVLYVRT